MSFKNVDEALCVADNPPKESLKFERRSTNYQLMNHHQGERLSSISRLVRGVLYLLRAAIALCALTATNVLLAQNAPKLVSVSPADGDTNAAPKGTVVFEFDQAMDITTPLQATVSTVVIGNYQFTPAFVNTQFTGRWGADRRILTFQPGLAIALNTAITWTLNPAGTKVPIKSASGQPLETITGSFKIAINSGGSPNEVCPPVTPAPGTYVVTKNFQYSQTSANDPVPAVGTTAIFGVTIQNPPAGPAVTGGAITFPDGTTKNLAFQFGVFRLIETYTSEAAVEAARPQGSYTLRFTQTGEPERVIPMNLPAPPWCRPQDRELCRGASDRCDEGFHTAMELFFRNRRGSRGQTHHIR